MCLCGDTMCWSCGPAQGFDPAFEKHFEKFCASEKAKEIEATFSDPDSEECADALRKAAQECFVQEPDPWDGYPEETDYKAEYEEWRKGCY